VLEPLAGKYPDRAYLFELLGMTSFIMHDPEAAREAFVKALELIPPEKRTASGPGSASLLQYNLATSYLLSGFPLMAYETIQKVDCDAMGQPPHTPIDPKACREFSQVCDGNVTAMAEEAGLPRDQFLAYGLALEKGHLALPRNQPELARQYFHEAIRLQPTESQPYVGLSSAYTLEGQPDEARQQLEYVLENLAPGDPATLNSLLRLLVVQGKNEEARSYREQLAALPLPELLESRVELAGAWAYLDEDRPIFELIEPILNSPQEWKELLEMEQGGNDETLAEALLLGVVSAAHLDRVEQAISWLEKAAAEALLPEDDHSVVLLTRIWHALANDEAGPRPGGRFFYYNPTIFLQTILLGQPNLAEVIQGVKQGEELSEETENLMQRMEEHSHQFLEALVYNVWVDNDLASMAASLDLIAQIESEQPGQAEPGKSETLERLAFSRSGGVLLHLTALATLIRRGVVAEDAPVTIWLGDRQQTGTFKELAEVASEESPEEEPDPGETEG
jgi:tetratricopeptide (TPR) repeat protein